MLVIKSYTLLSVVGCLFQVYSISRLSVSYVYGTQQLEQHTFQPYYIPYDIAPLQTCNIGQHPACNTVCVLLAWSSKLMTGH